MLPIEQHNWFIRSSSFLTAVGRLGAQFQLPDSIPIPSNRPVLMAGNHRSFLDLIASQAALVRFGLSSHILVREDLVIKGLAGRYFRSIGCIAASAKRAAKAEAEAVAALKAGHLVAIMPEGRLVAPDDWVDGVGRGRPGVSRIAVAADAVVLPIGISGTNNVWPRGRAPRLQLPRPKVTVRVGALMEMESTDHQENTDRVMKAISDLLVA